MRLCTSVRRTVLAVCAVLNVVASTVSIAEAQYGSYYSYRNPRTGQSYSFGSTYGRGGYSGFYSHSSRSSYYSNYHGGGGGPSNRHYWGGSSYGTPNYGYRTRWGW